MTKDVFAIKMVKNISYLRRYNGLHKVKLDGIYGHRMIQYTHFHNAQDFDIDVTVVYVNQVDIRISEASVVPRKAEKITSVLHALHELGGLIG